MTSIGLKRGRAGGWLAAAAARVAAEDGIPPLECAYVVDGHSVPSCIVSAAIDVHAYAVLAVMVAADVVPVDDIRRKTVGQAVRHAEEHAAVAMGQGRAAAPGVGVDDDDGMASPLPPAPTAAGSWCPPIRWVPTPPSGVLSVFQRLVAGLRGADVDNVHVATATRAPRPGAEADAVRGHIRLLRSRLDALARAWNDTAYAALGVTEAEESHHESLCHAPPTTTTTTRSLFSARDVSLAMDAEDDDDDVGMAVGGEGCAHDGGHGLSSSTPTPASTATLSAIPSYLSLQSRVHTPLSEPSHRHHRLGLSVHVASPTAAAGSSSGGSASHGLDWSQLASIIKSPFGLGAAARWTPMASQPTPFDASFPVTPASQGSAPSGQKRMCADTSSDGGPGGGSERSGGVDWRVACATGTVMPPPPTWSPAQGLRHGMRFAAMCAKLMPVPADGHAPVSMQRGWLTVSRDGGDEEGEGAFPADGGVCMDVVGGVHMHGDDDDDAACVWSPGTQHATVGHVLPGRPSTVTPPASTAGAAGGVAGSGLFNPFAWASGSSTRSGGGGGFVATHAASARMASPWLPVVAPTPHIASAHASWNPFRPGPTASHATATAPAVVAGMFTQRPGSGAWSTSSLLGGVDGLQVGVPGGNPFTGGAGGLCASSATANMDL